MTQTDSPIRKCLDMIVKVQDMVSTFQTEVHPKSVRPHHPKAAKEENFEIIPSLKNAVEVLRSRLSGHNSTIINLPNFRRFKQVLPHEGLIGPGSYQVNRRSISQEQELITIPRFDDKFDHKLSIIKVRRSALTIEDVSKLAILDNSINKTPKDSKEIARIHNQKIELVKSTAKEIKEYTQESRKIKLNEKLERIKWLEKKDEIIELKNSWRRLLTKISIASIFYLKIKNYKVIFK
jgi:hypothetical protein